ncbi:MAG: hypothetical protein FJ278_16555, partial [Planctomycetes bacterium]|nr:hypothetical protein [Planctomycetota bacterium]
MESRIPWRYALLTGALVGLALAAADMTQWVLMSHERLEVLRETAWAIGLAVGYALMGAVTLWVWSALMGAFPGLRGTRAAERLWPFLGLGVFVAALTWVRVMDVLPAYLLRSAPAQALEGCPVRAEGWSALLAFGAGLLSALAFIGASRSRRFLAQMAGWASPTRAMAGVVCGSAVLVAGLGVVAFVGMTRTNQPGPDAPNVLLLSIDTLRPDYLSCYNPKAARTPHIDEMAKSGVLFQRALSHAPWTRPSVGSIMTGRYPSVHGAGLSFRHGMSRAVRTLAEMLQENGFRTQAFIANEQLGDIFGFAAGFDVYSTYENHVRQGILEAQCGRWVTLRLLAGTRGRGDVNCAVNDYADSTPFIVEEATRWLARHGRRPFFLWLHLMDPHEFFRYRIVRVSEGTTAAGLPEVRFEREALGAKDASYVDNVAYSDAAVGRVMAQLKALGISEKTLVILTADHGEAFGEHGGHGHGHTLYRELLHVPLILSLPKRLPAGGHIEQQVRLMDIVPTVLELANLPEERGLDGQSLVSVIRRIEPQGREAYSEFLWPGYRLPERKSLASRGYKCIYCPSTGETELYDLDDDPRELHNVAESQSVLAAEFVAKLTLWMESA